MQNNPQEHLELKCFTTDYHGIVSVLYSDVNIGPAFNIKKMSAPILARPYKAIWDTGATGTVITKKVAEECQLEPVGSTKVHTAGGEINSSLYLISIMLPNKQGFAWIKATEAELAPPIDVLIGMDIISQGDFAVSNFKGKTILTYRSPSISPINFVEEANKKQEPIIRSTPKVGRNDPCPCGSGKKYKRCCEK
jgi:predicted aspartyl protease